jgi:hypothetical protein
MRTAQPTTGRGTSPRSLPRSLAVACCTCGLMVLPFFVFAKDGGTGTRTVTLQAGAGSVTVPEGRVWKIIGVVPYKSESRIGTADFTIEGQMLVGEDRSLTVSGKFDLLVNRKTHPHLVVLPGSKIRVGDSRHKLTIKEYKEETDASHGR